MGNKFRDSFNSAGFREVTRCTGAAGHWKNLGETRENGQCDVIPRQLYLLAIKQTIKNRKQSTTVAAITRQSPRNRKKDRRRAFCINGSQPSLSDKHHAIRDYVKCHFLISIYLYLIRFKKSTKNDISIKKSIIKSRNAILFLYFSLA